MFIENMKSDNVLCFGKADICKFEITNFAT